MAIKVCTGCGESRPIDEFTAHKSGRDGRRSRCRACRRDELRRWRETSPRHPEYLAENADRIKTVQATAYQRDAERRKANQREWYAANREHALAQARVYYEANRERIAEQQKAYYEAHREEDLERSRAWQAANPERRREIAREWDRRNPDYRRLKEARRRAAKRGQFVEDVHPLVVLERDDGACGICGEDVDPFNFQVDHIVPLARGGEHSYANVQTAHPFCNGSKGARLL